MIEVRENIHGNKKRFEYAVSLIERFQCASVLDVGCGNGEHLTTPLAEHFPSVRFVGIDSDAATMRLAEEIAKHHTVKNIQFFTDAEFQSDEKFDLVIASEVIEHVERPGEFLLFLRSKLKPKGAILLTTPNGYGAFELMTAIETPLHLLGVMNLLSKLPGLRSLKVGNSYDTGNVADLQADTLAISPHVNFFSYKRLLTLFKEAGLRVEEYKPRALFGGLGFQQLIRSAEALHKNAYSSDGKSPYLVSGWMFVLKSSSNEPKKQFSYRRRFNERLRRRLTAKRWGTG
ncbi:MAG: class I SAM-dependent methyltransferase [Candidatus Kapabacteria bacterium]|jgi:SAM-dependent methyltransferase|nr:class I SAM-dependent methyltransferase [Candidatus Kapabacteria bacterium]